jgi:hypothetical protein
MGTLKKALVACSNGMHDSLQDELKAFEKDLSILLVRFMKICDKVERQTASAPMAPSMAAPVAPKAPAPPTQKPVDLRAYA